MRSSTFTHAVDLVQTNVEAQEKVHRFTSNRGCSSEELLTAGKAQLSSQLLQHQAVRQGEEEWFSIIPKERHYLRDYVLRILKQNFFFFCSKWILFSFTQLCCQMCKTYFFVHF